MEWISVKDELPKVGEQVLITDGALTYYSEMTTYEGWTFQIAEDWDYNNQCFNLNAMQKKHVTHWMPLPEPPK